MRNSQLILAVKNSKTFQRHSQVLSNSEIRINCDMIWKNLIKSYYSGLRTFAFRSFSNLAMILSRSFPTSLSVRVRFGAW